MGVWSIIKLEGYCLYSHTKDKKIKFARVDDIKLLGKLKESDWKEKDNPNYNSKPRPDFCKKEFPGKTERIPNYKCLESDCPHFSYCEYEEQENEHI